MKILFLLLLVSAGMGSCGHVEPIKQIPKAVVHYPKVVYNSCADEYAIETDSGQYTGVSYFGVTPPARSSYGGVLSYSVTSSSGVSDPSYVPPQLIVINSLHDTLKYTQLGGEFQFKDSIAAMSSYLSFVKECKDTEDVRNVPIRMEIRKRFIEDSAQRRADSIGYSKKHIEDSIFKCKHTYQ